MKGFFQSLLGFTAIFTSAQPLSSTNPTIHPDHPASIQFSKWLTAFNTQKYSSLLDYHTDWNFPYNATQTGPETEFRMSHQFGGLDIVELEPMSSRSSLVAIVKGKRIGRYFRISVDVDVSTPAYTITKFKIDDLVTPLKFISIDDPRRAIYEQAHQSLTPELREKIVDGFTRLLLDRYVNNWMAKWVKEDLEGKLGSGEYNQYENSYTFARRLSEDARNICNNENLWIAFVEPMQTLPSAAEETAMELTYAKSINYGFPPSQITYHNLSSGGENITVAHITITSFVNCSIPGALHHIHDILSSAASASALIIDLQSHAGGPSGSDYDTLSFILSHLLEPVAATNDYNLGRHSVQAFVDHTGNHPLSQLWTFSLPQHMASQRFSDTKPMVVITSRRTSPAGTELAHILQVRRRIPAVAIARDDGSGMMGEVKRTTSKLTRPVALEPVCGEVFEGEKWWLVAVPVAQSLVFDFEGRGSTVDLGRNDILVSEGVVEMAREVLLEMVLRGGGDETHTDTDTETRSEMQGQGESHESQHNDLK
ncbi:hypothetical protein G7Y89_g15343 [Cudoniella acicularis]|uniref:Tail specific protease domain-containing protein n=1 Tax=Cudoniella acicularis TaxID=354080 RepID=A0A8H4QNU5_9HELO|nr:hypothetical protein G7Y89_g15343 [Cudoniella acicularis]